MNIKLTVFFDSQFWVGIFERTCENCYEVCKVVFGSEPKDYEVHSFILENFSRLPFTRPVSAEQSEIRKINPKRLQREIRKEVAGKTACTKAQAALNLQREENKVLRSHTGKEMKEALEQAKFELRQQKKKEKKKGH